MTVIEKAILLRVHLWWETLQTKRLSRMRLNWKARKVKVYLTAGSIGSIQPTCFQQNPFLLPGNLPSINIEPHVSGSWKTMFLENGRSGGFHANVGRVADPSNQTALKKKKHPSLCLGIPGYLFVVLKPSICLSRLEKKEVFP